MDHTNSRRYFLKTAGSLLGAAFLGLWGTMIHTQRKSKKKELILSDEDGAGLNIHIPLNEFRPGKGEWEALGLSDAKQMARDFAEGVS